MRALSKHPQYLSKCKMLSLRLLFGGLFCPPLTKARVSGNYIMKKFKRISKEIKKKLKAEQGYLTIEATMVFSVLFFSLIFILFMGLVLYQNVNVQSVAIQASERGSIIYSSRVSDMSKGVKTLDDFLIRDPYRNVPFMDGGGKAEYSAIINKYIDENLGRRDIIRGETENKGDYVEVEDYLIAKRVKVNIKSGYKMPVDSIAEMFGKKGPFEIDTTAVSAVTDPADFVRNVDIAADVMKQTKIFGSVQKGYQAIKDAIMGITDMLK